MRRETAGELLRVYIREGEHWEGEPLHEAVVRAARELRLRAACAFPTVDGYVDRAPHLAVHESGPPESLAYLVEIVDDAERIERFLATLDHMIGDTIVTIEKVRMRIHRPNDPGIEFHGDDELQLENPPEIQPGHRHHKASFATTSDRVRAIIELAEAEMTHSRRVYIDCVDVLLALLREPEQFAVRVLAQLGVDAGVVEQCLREEVSREPASPEYGELLEQKSRGAAKWLRSGAVGSEHLLLALCEIRPSAATDILSRLDAQPREVCRVVLEMLGHHEDWQRWLADHPDM